MYKIKPTVLDSYRIYKDEIFDKSFDDLVKSIKGEVEQNESMLIGSEVHKYFETGKANLMEEELNQLKEISALLPLGSNEVKFQEETNGYLFSVVIDRMGGLVAHDFKVTKRFYGVDFYENSLQWKIYLLVSGCKKFTYHIIKRNDVRPYNFQYLEPFSFYPYPNMESEIMEYCNEFVEFCKENNLEEYILIEETKEVINKLKK